MKKVVGVDEFVRIVRDLSEICVYVDGACSRNPGPGGWGVFMICDGYECSYSGGDRDTTNNRMELMAAIKALDAIKGYNGIVLMYTDSQYVKGGITDWIKKWKVNGWKTSGGDEVKNRDLWVMLDSFCEAFDIRWHWVKGHSDNAYNNIADQLARDAIRK